MGSIADMSVLRDLMQEGVRQGVFPGGVLYVRAGSQVLFHEACGLADIYKNQPMTTETVFDLASLTKPLATAPAIMKLIDDGALKPGDRLKNVLPLFCNTDKQDITIAQLLAHTSGFPAHQPYYQTLSKLPESERRSELLQLLAAETLAHPPGEKIVYSDLGYMVLRGIVEAITKTRLDHFVSKALYRPLGLADLFFVDRFSAQPKGIKAFAATEFCPRRKTLIKGTVHDDNAYDVGGIDGQAGLFGTTTAVSAFLCELLAIYRGQNAVGILSRKSVFRMLEVQTRPDQAKSSGSAGRTWGFDMPDVENSSAGRFFSPTSVGHLGFTGSSFWIDVARNIIVLLFTNRVHPHRDNDAIKSFRPRIHDAVMKIF